jgi:hypothetical protein
VYSTQDGARAEPELRREASARVLVDGSGVQHSSGSSKGKHELDDEDLIVGIAFYEVGELVDRL